MDKLINSPIFISGHTRSGTNLLMRLLDGSDGLLCPPGVGKLNTLRRMAWEQGSSKESSAERQERILKAVELKLESDKEEKLRILISKNIRESKATGFKSDIRILLNSFREYSGFDEGKKLNRWVEKNHNLEFYFGRAMQAFADPKLLMMLRDPRDVWGSWREECNRQNSDTGKSQMIRNLQQHLVEEAIESSLGLSRFNDLRHIQDYYKVPKENYSKMCACISNVMFNGIQGYDVNDRFIDVDAFQYSDSDAGRFAWNYRIIAERSRWLMENYSNNVLITKYEDLTQFPEAKVKLVTDFCGIQVPNSITPTEIGQTWGGNSSYENSFQGVSTNSVGRWKEKLSEQEVSHIMDVAWESYNGEI